MASEALSVLRGGGRGRGVEGSEARPPGTAGAARGQLCPVWRPHGGWTATMPGRVSGGSRGTVRPPCHQPPDPRAGPVHLPDLDPGPHAGALHRGPCSRSPAARQLPRSPASSLLRGDASLGVHGSECVSLGGGEGGGQRGRAPAGWRYSLHLAPDGSHCETADMNSVNSRAQQPRSSELCKSDGTRPQWSVVSAL